MNAREVGFAVAAAAAVIGLLGVVSPAFDPSSLHSPQSSTIVGAVAIGVGALAARQWIDHEPDQYGVPEVEPLEPVAVVGEDADELFELSTSGSQEVRRYYRSRSREYLRDVALATLTTHGGYTEAEAERQLREGTWTDDPVAASAFQPRADASAEGVGGMLGERIGREHPTTRRIRHVVEALQRIRRGDAD